MTIKTVIGHQGALIDIEDDIDINKALVVFINQVENIDPSHHIIPMLEEALEYHNEETGLE